MRRRAVLAAIVTLVACSSLQQQQYAVRRSNVSCDEANRYAVRTLKNMSVNVTELRPAAVGRDGVIRGTRATDTGRVEDVAVQISCGPDGVFLSASEERFLKQDVTFARGFFLGFTGLTDHAEAGAAYAEELSGGVSGGGVKVKIQPQLPVEAKLDFGEDLGAGGVLAVKVTIQNGSARSYKLDPASIELRPAEGRGKVTQVPIAQAALDIARGSAAALGEGAPKPDPARIEALLRERALAARRLEPGQQVEGFLYFPAGKYARARAELIDVETEESEGFLVEF